MLQKAAAKAFCFGFWKFPPAQSWLHKFLSPHWLCDVYLFAVLVTSLDRSLHYLLLSAYSSSPWQLLHSCLVSLSDCFTSACWLNIFHWGVWTHFKTQNIFAGGCPKADPAPEKGSAYNQEGKDTWEEFVLQTWKDFCESQFCSLWILTIFFCMSEFVNTNSKFINSLFKPI